MMDNIFIYLRAVSAFFRTLMMPATFPTSKSDQGEDLFDGWTQPASMIRINSITLHDQPYGALLGVQGPHKGEILLLSQDIETIGSHYGCTHAVDTNEPVYIHKGRQFESKGEYQHNGRYQYKSKAFDYDVFTFGKSIFLYMELKI